MNTTDSLKEFLGEAYIYIKLYIYTYKTLTCSNRYNNRGTEAGSSIELELIHLLLEGLGRRGIRTAVKNSFPEEMISKLGLEG